MLRAVHLDPAIEARLLALDAERVGEADVREVLAKGPAPTIVLLHGGVPGVERAMVSFADFLEGMGYPAERLRLPGGGRSYSGYTSGTRIAGLAAWHYEREGLRPMLVGHSQGGILVIRTLHELAGTYRRGVPVFDPVANRAERRGAIVDPLSGERRPVVGLRLPYASAVAAGGLSLAFLPTNWGAALVFRRVPDSVEEFTGFYLPLDVCGSDCLGLSLANRYRASNAARVRTVCLPIAYGHFTVPSSRHLAEHAETRAWINAYVQTGPRPAVPDLPGSTDHILWAADVWTSIKRHWCLEVQRLVRAKNRS